MRHPQLLLRFGSRLFFLSIVVFVFHPLGAQPRIAMSDTLLALGTLYHDQKVTRDVWIRNTGNENLHIESVTSPCGCATTEFMKYDVPSGDSAKLSITVNTAILLGKVRKYVIIVSNDPAQRNRFVYYEAVVINVLTANPSFLYMGEAPNGTELSKELSLRNDTKVPIRIHSVGSASGRLKFSHLRSLLVPGDSLKLTVGLKLGQEASFKDNIEIATDHPDQPIVRIGVLARARGRK